MNEILLEAKLRYLRGAERVKSPLLIDVIPLADKSTEFKSGNLVNKLTVVARIKTLPDLFEVVDGTLVKLFPLRMKVSTGVVTEMLARIDAVPKSPSPVDVQLTVTVTLLPVDRSQEQGEMEVAPGQRQMDVVKEEKLVVSVSPQTPPWMKGK